jgi:hypothetical protein
MKTPFSYFLLAGSLLVPAMFAQAQPAPTVNARPESVNARRERQQDRVAQGVKSGQLSARETANLENKESKLNKEIHTDRKANGGKLTASERRQVNRQQNKLSKQIYQDKHTAQTQPK